MQSRGSGCRWWLRRWHSVSWVSSKPLRLPGLVGAIGFVFGFGISMLCSLKMCSCKVEKVRHGAWARSHWWGYPGSLAFSLRCVVISASFPCTARQLLSSTPSWLPYSRSCRHPKSLVNLEVRLPKSIFSWQCKHYWARRTEVKATDVPHSGTVSECQSDTVMLTRLTSAIHYFQSSGHYPSWAHPLYVVTRHHRIDFKNQGLFNKRITSKSNVPCLLLNYALDRTESWSNFLIQTHKVILTKHSYFHINYVSPNLFKEHMVWKCLCPR